MTLREYKDKKYYWEKEYDYYSWACCQPSISVEHHNEDVKKRDEAFAQIKKFQNFENKVLTEALKNAIL